MTYCINIIVFSSSECYIWLKTNFNDIEFVLHYYNKYINLNKNVLLTRFM